MGFEVSPVGGEVEAAAPDGLVGVGVVELVVGGVGAAHPGAFAAVLERGDGEVAHQGSVTARRAAIRADRSGLGPISPVSALSVAVYGISGVSAGVGP